MENEKWEEKRPTIEGLREMGETFLSMYAINLWDLTLKLEKALDKACDELCKWCDDIENEKSLFMPSDWKEWCMKDAD